jgi:hypothetical protein
MKSRELRILFYLSCLLQLTAVLVGLMNMQHGILRFTEIMDVPLRGGTIYAAVFFALLVIASVLVIVGNKGGRNLLIALSAIMLADGIYGLVQPSVSWSLPQTFWAEFADPLPAVFAIIQLLSATAMIVFASSAIPITRGKMVISAAAILVGLVSGWAVLDGWDETDNPEGVLVDLPENAPVPALIMSSGCQHCDELMPLVNLLYAQEGSDSARVYVVGNDAQFNAFAGRNKIPVPFAQEMEHDPGYAALAGGRVPALLVKTDKGIVALHGDAITPRRLSTVFKR